ncbi:potassium:proton antiporter [Aureococcus anophagefferens]|nr:potassium:proton antiporter [Aureococcus anophagefferens]
MTIVITGESLFNDGTAMVVFHLFFEIMSAYRKDGAVYDVTSPGDWWSILVFFVRMAVGGPLIGFAFGFMALWALMRCTRSHEHVDATLQSTITLVCAYLSFFVAEQCAKASGVLSCVCAGLVLAKYASPLLANRHAMHHIWEMFEHVGNTVIFMLAGLLTGEAYCNLQVGLGLLCMGFVSYVVAMFVRRAARSSRASAVRGALASALEGGGDDGDGSHVKPVKQRLTLMTVHRVSIAARKSLTKVGDESTVLLAQMRTIFLQVTHPSLKARFVDVVDRVRLQLKRANISTRSKEQAFLVLISFREAHARALTKVDSFWCSTEEDKAATEGDRKIIAGESKHEILRKQEKMIIAMQTEGMILPGAATLLEDAPRHRAPDHEFSLRQELLKKTARNVRARFVSIGRAGFTAADHGLKAGGRSMASAVEGTKTKFHETVCKRGSTQSSLLGEALVEGEEEDSPRPAKPEPEEEKAPPDKPTSVEELKHLIADSIEQIEDMGSVSSAGALSRNVSDLAIEDTSDSQASYSRRDGDAPH